MLVANSGLLNGEGVLVGACRGGSRPVLIHSTNDTLARRKGRGYPHIHRDHRENRQEIWSQATVEQNETQI